MTSSPQGSPLCCPHCSADLVPVGADGVCWQCHKPISPEEIKGQPKIPSPSPILSKSERRITRYLKLVVVALLLCVLSLTKGFFAFAAVPLLFIVLPIIIQTQITTDFRLANDTAHPSMPRLAAIQLASAFALFFSFPMAGDGTPTVIYIIDGAGTPLLILCVASGLAFAIATVKFHNASRATPSK